jgi:hypothetical protein
VSEVCDSLGANPFGNYSSCLAYAAGIPQNAPTPCDNPGRVNNPGDSITCRSFGISAGYASAIAGNIPELEYVCASVGPASSPLASCVPAATYFMDPQCETYLPPVCKV